MNDWSAGQYLRFEDERTRAARDLLAQVPLVDARHIVDIGCGPGNSTELLAGRYPGAGVTGIDTSPAMLAEARRRLPRCSFIEADVAGFSPAAGTDLVFANAVFQWVPDHLGVLGRLAGELAPDAVLAVQMPDNLDEPSHALMREVARSGPWAAKLGSAAAARDAMPTADVYYDRLKPVCRRVDIWHIIYNHPLDGAAGIVEWLKSTGLRPYINPLDAAEREDYLARYGAAIARAYPARCDGMVLLRFPRLFILAVK